MSHNIHRPFDPRECLEMEIKEDLAVGRSVIPHIKHDPSLIQPNHLTPVSTSHHQPHVNQEPGYSIQIRMLEHEDLFNLDKNSGTNIEDISESGTPPYYKKSKEALYKLLLEDEECSFKCNQCSFETIYRIDIIKHMKTHSNNPKPQKMFPCSVCPYVASQKHHLQTHISTRHTNDKPFACTICSYTSATKAHLQTHLLSHSTEKPFQCPTCPYSTARKGNLQAHLIIHSETKPHQCPYCSYSATQKTHLQFHLVVHTGEKPYTCQHCSYSAAKKTSLQIHIMMTHTGEKPYSCQECTYSTAQKGNLQRHLKIHNRERPIKPSIGIQPVVHRPISPKPAVQYIKKNNFHPPGGHPFYCNTTYPLTVKQPL